MKRLPAIALSLTIAVGAAVPALADEAAAKAALTEIEATLGFVPSFVKALPQAAIPGAWAEARDLLYSDTALDAKTKSLISLAVAAQIPCSYCIYDDTNAARRAGASDEEIREAVAVAALTRHWSTIFNGNQVDLDGFKAEMGGM